MKQPIVKVFEAISVSRDTSKPVAESPRAPVKIKSEPVQPAIRNQQKAGKKPKDPNASNVSFSDAVEEIYFG